MDRYLNPEEQATNPEDEDMNYYFVVDSDTGVVSNIVQRNKTPDKVSGKKFVKATGVQMTFFHRLSTSQSEVTLEQVLKY